MTSQGFRNIAAGIAWLVVAVVVANLGWNARLLMRGGQETAADVRQVTHTAADWFEAERERASSPKNAKALDAAIQAGAVFNATGRLLNTQTIPRFNREMDALTAMTGRLDSFIVATDQRVNGADGLLVSVTALVNGLARTADRFGVTVEEINAAVRMASEKTGLSLDALYSLLSRPEWLETLKHLDGTAANVETVTANAAKASEQMPSIAASLEKIAKTSSRFTKITLIANVIATLARAFIL